MKTDHHMATSNFPLKKSSWIDIQFAKCNDFFCVDVWLATHPKTGQRNDFRGHRSKVTFVFFTTHKTVTHKLLQPLRSSFCIGMCWWPHKQREDFHLLQTGLSLSSLLLFVILTFFWCAETGKILAPFLLVWDRKSGKLSGPMPEVEVGCKSLRRFSKCNIQFFALWVSKSFIFFAWNRLCCSTAGR